MCELTKPASQSGVARHRQRGESPCQECKAAASENRRIWRAANPEKIKADRKTYYEANKELIRTKQAAYYEANGELLTEIRANWRRANPDKIREDRSNYHLRSVHGMSRAEWQAMWDAQDGCCYLCGDPLIDGNRRKVHVDHDHSCCGPKRSCSRCRRGLACYRCNAVVGMSQDDPERLMRIAANLARVQTEALGHQAA